MLELAGSGTTYGDGDPRVIAAHFDKQAPRYEKGCQKVGWNVPEIAVDLLKQEGLIIPDQSARVLDLGAGTGELGHHLKLAHGGSVQVTGVDLSSKMLEVGTASGAIDLAITGSITARHVEVASQNLVTSFGVLDFIKPGIDTWAVVQEVRHALSEGGIFAISVEPDGTANPGVKTYKHSIPALKEAFENAGLRIIREEHLSHAYTNFETGEPVENVILIGKRDATPISGFYLNQLSAPGFAFEATPEALGLTLVPTVRTHYTAAAAARAVGKEEIKRERALIARPLLLAQSIVLPADTQNIGFPALFAKQRGSVVIGLPTCLAFADSMAKLVATDLLTLYGPELFAQCEIEFIVKRREIESGESLRPEFEDWHTHMAPQHGTDLIYGFCDVLPTEFKTPSGDIIAPPENSLVRFGAEIVHRSRVNPSSEPLRRTWGAFVVSFGQKPKNGSTGNHALGTYHDLSLAVSRGHTVSGLKALVPAVPLEELSLAAN